MPVKALAALHASTMLKVGSAGVSPMLDAAVTDRWVADFDAETFIAGEPEELVLDDGPAGRAAKLLQRCRVNRTREVVRGIGLHRIAAEGKAGAMQGIGARFDPHVYNRSVPPAVFSRGVLLGIEFLNGIDGERTGGISGEPLALPLIRLLALAISIETYRPSPKCQLPNAGHCCWRPPKYYLPVC